MSDLLRKSSLSGSYMIVEPGSDRTTFTPVSVDPLEPRPWSYPMGYATVVDTYFRSDPPEPAELSAALSVIELHLDDLAREDSEVMSPDDGRTALQMTMRDGSVVGTGPVFTIMAAIEIGLDSFDAKALDGFVLTRAAAEDVFRTLATEPLEDRLHNPGLPAAWGNAIVGAACLVVETYRRFDIEAITVDCTAKPGPPGGAQ